MASSEQTVDHSLKLSQILALMGIIDYPDIGQERVSSLYNLDDVLHELCDTNIIQQCLMQSETLDAPNDDTVILDSSTVFSKKIPGKLVSCRTHQYVNVRDIPGRDSDYSLFVANGRYKRTFIIDCSESSNRPSDRDIAGLYDSAFPIIEAECTRLNLDIHRDVRVVVITALYATKRQVKQRDMPFRRVLERIAEIRNVTALETDGLLSSFCYLDETLLPRFIPRGNQFIAFVTLPYGETVTIDSDKTIPLENIPTALWQDPLVQQAGIGPGTTYSYLAIVSGEAGGTIRGYCRHVKMFTTPA